jgi:hypothetical protein
MKRERDGNSMDIDIFKLTGRQGFSRVPLLAPEVVYPLKYNDIWIFVMKVSDKSRTEKGSINIST